MSPSTASGETPDPDATPQFASGESPGGSEGDGGPPQVPKGDPWRSFRGIMAGIHILEAIVVLLALPVVAAGEGGLTALSGTFLVGMAIVLVLLSGVQGRPGIIWVNLGIQALFIAAALIHGAIGFIGVIFAGVWALMIYLRAEVQRRQDRGLLPFQQPDRD